MRVDMHNHTIYCKHATGSMQEYVQRAEELGIDIYGFSCHAPMDFDQKYRMDFETLPKYINEVKNLKSSKMEILCALEVDFIANKQYLISNDFFSLDLDYLIGSVHFLDDWGFDNPEFLSLWAKKDLHETWDKYLDSINLMADSNLFDIVGHIDLLKIFGNKMPSTLESKLVKVLQNIKDHNLVVEINQAGLRKQVKELYPSAHILKIMKELDIDITFSSDAHSVDQVGYGYDEALKIIKDLGFKKQCIFRKRKKIELDI